MLSVRPGLAVVPYLPFTASEAFGSEVDNIVLYSSTRYKYPGKGASRVCNLLRLQDQLGSFEVGKDLTALMIDASSGTTFDTFSADSLLDTFEKFVNLGDDRCNQGSVGSGWAFVLAVSQKPKAYAQLGLPTVKRDTRCKRACASDARDHRNDIKRFKWKPIYIT